MPPLPKIEEGASVREPSSPHEPARKPQLFDASDSDGASTSQTEQERAQLRIVWRNVLIFILLHLGAVVGLYLAMAQAKWLTLAWTYTLYVWGGLGITAGAHRLWAHRTYKAKWPLRLLLTFFNCIALQNDVIEWSRDHRGHHKWTDTHADPHNINRGFFFAHMGWLVTKKHPEVIRRGKTLDMSDLKNDPILRFQQRFYLPLAMLICFVLPAVIPAYFWGESLFVAFYVCSLFRYTFTLHITWMVNSVAHTFGYKPYDTKIKPVESIITSLGALGEGFHNFHHTFPSDYKTAEIPYLLNFSTMFIDFFALFGLAYDRKSTSPEAIARQKSKHGS